MTPWAFMRASLLVFIAGLAVTIFALMLSGHIRTHGLLRDKCTGQMSPARLQLLVTLLAVAGGLLIKVLGSGQWPQIPGELLAMLGGSQSFYLSAKGISIARWQGALPKLLNSQR